MPTVPGVAERIQMAIAAMRHWAGLALVMTCAGTLWPQAPKGRSWAAVPAAARRHLESDEAYAPRGPLASAGVVILRLVKSDRLLADGSVDARILEEYKAITPLGVQRLTNLPVYYRGDTHLISVRVFVINGRSVQRPAADAVHDYATKLAEAAPMYTDLRERIFTLPALAPGSLVVLAIRLQVHSPDQAGQLTESWQPELYPVLARRLRIALPPGRRLRFATHPLLNRGARNMTFRHSERGTSRGPVYRFAWRNVPAASMAPYRPQQPPPFIASTYASWAAVARWYDRLAAPETRATPAIRAEAARLTAGQTTRAGKLRALYDYVAANVRYVSLSFGIGRVRPHAAAQVLANGYGDCKDKAALLIALLRACDIPGYFALLDASGRLQRSVPAVASFDHAIVAVPGPAAMRFVDATEPVRFGALLGDAGRWALIARPPGQAGPALVRIPAETAADNETRETDEIKVQSNGNIRADCRQRFNPLAGLFARLALHLAPAGHKHQIQEILARALATGTTLVSFHATPWPGLNRPFEVHSERRMVDEAEVTKPPFSVPLWWHINPVPLPAGTHRRRWPLELRRMLPAYHQVIHVTLPLGFIPTLPANTTLAPGFARFTIQYRFNAALRRITADGRLVWLRAQIPAAAAPAYRHFQKAVVNAEAGTIHLTLAPHAAPAVLAASLRRMERDVRRGNNADAVALGRALMAAAPQIPAVRADLASAWLAEKKYRSAIKILQPLAPAADAEMDGLLARAHLGVGDAALALPEVQAELKAMPYDAAATGLEGRIFAALGQHAAALEAYARAVKLDPASPRWLYHLGREQLAAGKDAAALGSFRSVAAAPTATSRELLGMAQAELATGRPPSVAATWADQGLAQQNAMLQGLDWSRLSAGQRRGLRAMPAAVEVCARLHAQQGQSPAALSLGRLAVALRPDKATWVERLARWEQRAQGAAAALPFWVFLLREPRAPPHSMQRLLAAYHALPKPSALPVDLYLAQHPAIQPQFAGHPLWPAPAPAQYTAIAWIAGGRVAFLRGTLPAAEKRRIKAEHFPVPEVAGTPLNYLLTFLPAGGNARIVPPPPLSGGKP